MQRRVDGAIGDGGDSTRHRDRRQVAGIERRDGLDGGGEGERLPLVNRDVGDVGRVHRLDAALGERRFDSLGDHPVHHVVVDLIAEPLLDDRRRRLARTEAGEAGLPRVALGDALDLRIDEIARDLDGEGFLRIGNVYEVGFHCRLKSYGLSQRLKAWKCERRDSNPHTLSGTRS